MSFYLVIHLISSACAILQSFFVITSSAYHHIRPFTWQIFIKPSSCPDCYLNRSLVVPWPSWRSWSWTCWTASGLSCLPQQTFRGQMKVALRRLDGRWGEPPPSLFPRSPAAFSWTSYTTALSDFWYTFALHYWTLNAKIYTTWPLVSWLSF